MLKRAQRPRPRITPRLLWWGLVDAFGMLMLSLGGGWLATGGPVLWSRFPTGRGEAWACVVLGVAIIFFAVVQILKELVHQLPQGPEAQQ